MAQYIHLVYFPLIYDYRWESGHFRLGQFHDECFKALTPGDKVNR